MTEPKGPIETIIHSPGFRRFWDDFVSDMQDLHDKFMRDSRAAIREGNDGEALTLLKRATGIEDCLQIATGAPATAVRHESESTHKTVIEEIVGYSGVS